MNRIENGMPSAETYKSFLILYGQWGGYLKHILTYLYWNKFIEISVRHLNVQKACFVYTISQKRFLIYYGLCLKTAGNVFSIVFHPLFLLY